MQLNSKEALKKLKSMPTCSECELYGSCFDKPLCNELYNTIKQDLDKLESLERFKKRLLEDTNKLYNENQKLKKVIEILKEKIIDKCKILNSKNVEEYNNYVLCGFDFFDILTPEEYELLKEVLEND